MELGGTGYLDFVGSDFLDTCFSAINMLYQKKKHNLIRQLCKCFESSGVNGMSKMPLDRMPFGLLDYNIRFYASSRTNLVDYEEHYASWLDTMFSQFGHKWLCLHRGPAWQYEMAVDPIELDASVNCGNSLVERALQESGLDLNTYNEDVDDLNSLSDIFELSLSSDLGCDQSLAEESTSTDCLSVVTPNTYASSENGRKWQFFGNWY